MEAALQGVRNEVKGLCEELERQYAGMTGGSDAGSVGNANPIELLERLTRLQRRIAETREMSERVTRSKREIVEAVGSRGMAVRSQLLRLQSVAGLPQSSSASSPEEYQSVRAIFAEMERLNKDDSS